MFGWELKIRLNCTIVSEQTEKCVQPFWYVNSILCMFVFLLVAYSLHLDSCKWTKWSACTSRDRRFVQPEAVLASHKISPGNHAIGQEDTYMRLHDVTCGGEMWDSFVCLGLYKAIEL